MLDPMMSLPLPAMPGAMAGAIAGALSGALPGASPGATPNDPATAAWAEGLFAQLLEAQSVRVDLTPLKDAARIADVVIDEPAAAPPDPTRPVPTAATEAALPLPAPDPALLAQLAMPAAGPERRLEPATDLASPTPTRQRAATAITRPEREGAAPPVGPQARTAAAEPVLPAAAFDTRPESQAAARIAPREEAALPGPLAALGAARHVEALANPATEPAAPSRHGDSIGARVESPDFAPELAARVSVLARDGVHRAELRLNPLELGPMAVQIAIDGAHARVDFGAEAAVTRAAIEASLPALASALRDAGLTLAGGGVSQHMPGQGERQGPWAGAPDAGSASPARADGTAEPEVARAASRVVRAGGVDLYA